MRAARTTRRSFSRSSRSTADSVVLFLLSLLAVYPLTCSASPTSARHGGQTPTNVNAGRHSGSAHSSGDRAGSRSNIPVCRFQHQPRIPTLKPASPAVRMGWRRRGQVDGVAGVSFGIRDCPGRIRTHAPRQRHRFHASRLVAGRIVGNRSWWPEWAIWIWQS